jgi:hypothetical protein
LARETALLRAALHARSCAVRALLAAGANPDLQDASGGTALHVAAALGHSDAAASLRAANADGNARDGAGFTPLGRALHQPATHFDAKGSGPIDTRAVAKLLAEAGGRDEQPVRDPADGRSAAEDERAQLR